jgi:hypothetical protein
MELDPDVSGMGIVENGCFWFIVTPKFARLAAV